MKRIFQVQASVHLQETSKRISFLHWEGNEYSTFSNLNLVDVRQCFIIILHFLMSPKVEQQGDVAQLAERVLSMHEVVDSISTFSILDFVAERSKALC